MFYTIYKITNTINDKIYIGKHQTENLNDTYMGSGVHLRRAIRKYGINNFKKEVLFQFDDESEMNKKEAELVTEEFCLREDTYNLCPGGHGGFGYINRSPDIRKRAGTNAIAKQREFLMEKYGVDHLSKTESGRNAISIRNRVLHLESVLRPPTFTGKCHSDETKIKMSNSAKHRKSNSQTGTMWITNGQENKKIKKDIDIIPEGWYKGRSMNYASTAGTG